MAANLAQVDLIHAFRRSTAATIYIMWDFGPFHGGPNSTVGRNYLYLDGHVGN